MIAGIDVGASTTKGVILEDLEIICHHSSSTEDTASSALETLKSLLAKTTEGRSVRLVAASGCGSRKIGDTLLSFPVEKVDEIQATGLGGLILARKRKGLIVSVGTGTAMVVARDWGKKIAHVGGTGVGGGTLLGLSKRMLGVDDFKALEEMASSGDANKVDLTVFDIVGGPVGIVPAEATASNFGRSEGEATEDDVAAGIFNLVCQVVGVVGAMAAKAHDLEDHVVIVGRLPRSTKASEIIIETMELFGTRAFIPENCEYCTAVGAAAFLTR